MFKDLKSSGFDVEETSCRDEVTMDKLMVILSVAYNGLIAWFLIYGNDSFRELVTRHHKKKQMDELSVFAMAHLVFDQVSQDMGIYYCRT